MTLLDRIIRTNRLCEFAREVIQTHNEETKEKTLWEYYLHRVFDMSFQDFKDSLPQEADVPSDEEIVETISCSADMLNGFNPCQ